MVWHFPPVSRFESHKLISKIISLWFNLLVFSFLSWTVLRQSFFVFFFFFLLFVFYLHLLVASECGANLLSSAWCIGLVFCSALYSFVVNSFAARLTNHLAI